MQNVKKLFLENKIFSALGLLLLTFDVVAELRIEDDYNAVTANNRIENSITETDLPRSSASMLVLPPSVNSYTNRKTVIPNKPINPYSSWGAWAATRMTGTADMGLIMGPVMTIFNMGMVVGLVEVIPGLTYLFPFLDSGDPAWLEDLYNRLEEMEEYITSEIIGFAMEENFSEARSMIENSRSYYFGYMAKSRPGETHSDEIDGILGPTPVHRSRVQAAYTYIDEGLSALEVGGLDELDRILSDYKDDPRFTEILEEMYRYMFTVLPYLVDTGIERYQTYKWPENALHTALQERYEDSAVKAWAHGASEVQRSEYVRLFGDFGPGEPYYYDQPFRFSSGMMALTEKEYQDSTLLRYLKTINDFREIQDENIIRASVGELQAHSDTRTHSCNTSSGLCSTTIEWEYAVLYHPADSEQQKIYVKADKRTFRSTDTGSRNEANKQKNEDIAAVVEFRENLLEDITDKVYFVGDAGFNSMIRWFSERTGVDYTDSFDTSGPWDEDPEFHPQYYLASYDDLEEEEYITQFNFEGAYAHWLEAGKQEGRLAWFAEDEVTALNNEESLVAIYQGAGNTLYGVDAQTSTLYQYEPLSNHWQIDFSVPPLDKTVNTLGRPGVPLTRLIATYDYTHPQAGKLQLLGLGRDDGRLYYPNSTAGEWHDISEAFPNVELFAETTRFIDLSVSQAHPQIWWAITAQGRIYRIGLDDNPNKITINEISNHSDGDNLIRILSYDDDNTWALGQDRQLYRWELNTDTNTKEWGSKEWVSKGAPPPTEEVKQWALSGSHVVALNSKGGLYTYSEQMGWAHVNGYFDSITGFSDGSNDNELYGLIAGNAYQYSGPAMTPVPRPTTINLFEGNRGVQGEFNLTWNFQPTYQQPSDAGWEFIISYKKDNEATFEAIRPFSLLNNPPVYQALILHPDGQNNDVNFQFYVQVRDKYFGTISAPSPILVCQTGGFECEGVS